MQRGIGTGGRKREGAGHPAAVQRRVGLGIGRNSSRGKPSAASFDWSSAEKEVADIVQPAFVEAPADVVAEDDFEGVHRSGVSLADVAGMADVKRQLELSLLGPIRNPELMKAYKVSARGGLLLYGPLGAARPTSPKLSRESWGQLYQVGIADVMHHWFGDSERAVRAVFDTARRNTPVCCSSMK